MKSDTSASTLDLRMSNGTTTIGNETAPGGTTTEAPKSETLSKETIKAIFDEGFAGFRKTINGEMADHRRKLEASKSGGETPPAAPATIEDIKLSREVGRLEAQLGQEVLATLGEEYESATVAEQARMLRLASKLNAHKPAAETAGQSSRGETPVATAPNPRGQAPATRSAITMPRTMAEFVELKKRDPQAAHDLYNNPAFDPTKLTR